MCKMYIYSVINMDKYYAEAADKIERCEYNTVLPVSDLNYNSPNKFTVFKLDHGDAFYDKHILYHINGEVVTKASNTAYTEADPIKLIDNFTAFLFKRIELKKHNQVIDVVDEVGITSTIKALTTYSKSAENTYYTSGFKSKYTKGVNKFEAIGPLSHLGLGFFDHLKYPMFKGGFEIVFTRAEDDDAIYRWEEGTGANKKSAAEGKIKITSFVLRVPLVDYDPVKRAPLIQGLKRLSDSGNLSYRYIQWQCIDKFGVHGTSYSFDISNIFRNISDPIFIIIGLQTKRKNDQTRDPSEFDAINIKNYYVKINGTRYPQEPQNLAVKENQYGLLYNSYLSVRQELFHDEDVYVNDKDFIDKYPLIVVDTHHHPFSTDAKRNDIQVHLDFTGTVGAPVDGKGTTAYVVVMSETGFDYDLDKNYIKMH